MRFFFQSKTAILKFHTVVMTLGIFLLAFFVWMHPVVAAESALDTIGATSGASTESLPILIARLIRMVLGVLGIITVLFVLYAGWLYMSAGSNPEKVKTAKKLLGRLVIGLMIIFSSFSIATFILNKLLAAAYGQGSITTTTKKYGEPLAGSLGSGILDNHYPIRNAQDIPRNTQIFVTFKEPINPATIIKDYLSTVNPPSTKLNVEGVKIYESSKGEKSALNATQVEAYTNDKMTFVFKPISYLGSPDKNVNYTVELTPKIQKEKGGDAFTGVYSSGYDWNFTVSTNIDLTPPYVTAQTFPQEGAVIDRNNTVEITFNEPVNPIATTGMYGKEGKAFSNITTTYPDPNQPKESIIQSGIYEIANGYRTVSFKTFDVCAKDPCGGDVTCLPSQKKFTVTAKAATLDPTNIPQAKIGSTLFDGVVDAAGNSLDGVHDNKACGSEKDTVACLDGAKSDDFVRTFSTNDNIDKTVPKIESLDPNVGQGGIDVKKDLTITFNTLLSAPTLNGKSISLSPEPFYPMWFSVLKEDLPEKKTVVHITHPPFVPSSESDSQLYWPLLTHEVKGNNQFCMYPAVGATCNATDLLPFCCNGKPGDLACKTDVGTALPIVPK